MYKECIQLTRQFTFCPNAFRVDLYKGCDFGCQYCFANMVWCQHKKTGSNYDIGDINKIKRLFHTALETDKTSKDIIVEMIRNNVPLHCGGMSDPFQAREKKYGLTKQFIELSNQYYYPVQFSTKANEFPDNSYWEIINPDIHAFQVSIMGYNDDYIRKWECNTPTAKERLKFVQKLKNKGFWCGVRIQPIIDIEQAEKLCNHINNVDYVTMEHFKTVTDIMEIRDAIIRLYPDARQLTISNGKIEVRKDIKIANIKRLKKILNDKGIPVGVGDNDLHYMTDGRCCCGSDRIDRFKNYLKYNLTYFCTGEHTGNEWIMKCNPRKHINDQKYGLKIDCKQYVDEYIELHEDYMHKKQGGLF